MRFARREKGSGPAIKQGFIFMYLRCCLINKETMLGGSYVGHLSLKCTVSDCTTSGVVIFLQGWNYQHLKPIHILKRATCQAQNCPADQTTYSTWKRRSCCIVSMMATTASSGVTGSFLYTLKSEFPGGDFEKLVTPPLCPPFKPKSDYMSFQTSVLAHPPCLWSPVCCLMGSWPQGRGYSLSFLQLVFTVSLAELMHHIFEAQVPWELLGDCGQDLTGSFYPFPPALLAAVSRIPWRLLFQANCYQPIKGWCNT